MAEVARVVAGLLERAQDQRGERGAAASGPAHVRVDQAGDLGGALPRLLRRQRLGQRRRGHVERGQLLGQARDARGVRALVDAVERRQLARLQVAGDRLVGRDHQVLDQLVRLGLLARHDAGHVALVREVELRLDRLDGQRAALRPCGLERRGRRPRRGQRRGPRLLGALAAREDPVDPRVVEPGVGADDGAVERAAHELRAVEVELDGDGQAVLEGHERAGVVGQGLGQHRLDLAGHVHAGRAAVGLAVDRGARRHMRGDVRDVHPHPDHAALEPLRADRVVEVARRGRIDRERRQRAQVAPGDVVPPARSAASRASRSTTRVEAPPQPAVEHQRLEHVAGGVRAADPAQQLPVPGARPGRGDQHDVARRGLLAGARAVEVDPAPAREERLGDEEAAAAFQHGDHGAGGAARRPVGGRRDSVAAEAARAVGRRGPARRARLAAAPLLRTYGTTPSRCSRSELARESAPADCPAHVAWRATVLTATSSASSRRVSVSSSAFTSGLIPAPLRTPPPPRLRPLGV